MLMAKSSKLGFRTLLLAKKGSLSSSVSFHYFPFISLFYTLSTYSLFFLLPSLYFFSAASASASISLLYFPLIPAIRAVNNDGFKPNLETHLIPLLATKVENTSLESKEKSNITKAAHHPLLMQVLSDELSCGIEDIANIELNVCDTQPSCLGGANNEFIFSGRLDNLASSYCALRALIDSCETPTDLSSEHAIRMIALFDNEEIMRLFPFAGLIN
ncbi:putative aspartyl aminopeptidase [Camellia lanceoleosa]|uniref:Aspartyl aminopeptidase n=1 Tax=Camellia lanceoleosa TaxID=1840588 RepID=A0ACC0G1G3_9ERIC|nr:putative aspartyl aminopeptidase [Camellia lanceoleosa]